MKGLIPILFFLTLGTNAQAIDYGALSNSLQYLGTKWVDAPAPIQNIPQYRVEPLPQRQPTCIVVPIYSVIDPTVILRHDTRCFHGN